MIFETLPEYDKDLKTLLKKYRTLISDLDDVKKVLTVRPDANRPTCVVVNFNWVLFFKR